MPSTEAKSVVSHDGDLISALRSHAEKSPHETAFSWLKNDCTVETLFSWAELWHFSGMLGEKLVASQGVKRGDRVMIVYPFGLDFIIAFLACIRVGIIVVSVYPPNPARLAGDIAKFRHFVEDCQATIALTTRKYSVMVRYTSMLHKWPKNLTWISTDVYSRGKVPLCAQLFKTDCTAGAEELLFIQYTSGSTGNPKGVMITYGNLKHQLYCLSTSFIGMHDILVGWVPQYHDMGLFNILTSLYTKTRVYMMSPVQFIQNPILWPQAIEKFKATCICGPNFAYALTCKRLKESGKRFNCSSVVSAGFGAEPTQPSTIDSAVNIFGIKKAALTNIWGLAEHCVYAMGIPGGHKVDKNVVSVGSISRAKEFGILVVVATPLEGVDDVMVAVEEEQVGEVCLQSASVAAGYWGKEELTRATFCVSIGGLEGTFLRTGDLGYVTGDSLYLTCRLKDLIIINGRNVWPADLETAAEAEFPEHVRPGCSVAFQGSEEGAILICEVRQALSNPEGVAGEVRKVVERKCGVTVEQVVLVAKGAVPKTTSGKVERGKAARMLKEGTLQSVALSRNTVQLEAARSLEELLALSGVEDWSKTVLENGLTSMQVMQLVNIAKRNLGVDLEYEVLHTTAASDLLDTFGSSTAQLRPLLVSPPPQHLPPPPGLATRIALQLEILVALLLVILAAAVPTIAAVDSSFDGESGWWLERGRAGPLIGMAVGVWMLSYTLLCIILKWLLVGRMRAVYLPLWSGRFAAWMLVERLFTVWEYTVGRFFLQTPWINVFYWLLGANVSSSARINSFFRCWDLVSLGPRASLSGLLYPRVFDSQGVRFGTIRLGAGSSVRAMAVLQGPVEVGENVEVEAAAVVPPYSELNPPGSSWYGNLCRRRPSPPAAREHSQPSSAGWPDVNGATSLQSFLEFGSSSAGDAVPLSQEAAKQAPPVSSAAFHSASASSRLGDNSLSLGTDKPHLDSSETLDSPLSPEPATSAAAARVRSQQAARTCNSEPLWLTRLALPVVFVAANAAAFMLATRVVPDVTPSSAEWSLATWWLGLSYVATLLVTGLILLALVVLLKWTFLSPFLTDAFAALAVSTYLPFIERSPVIVNLWQRLLGMHVESGACILYTWTCAPSAAHLCSVGANSVLFSTILAPRTPASLWSYLAGSSGPPWTEPRDIIIEANVGLYAQGRVESGVRVASNSHVAGFARAEPDMHIKAGTLLAGNPPIRMEHNHRESEVFAIRWWQQAGSLLLLLVHRCFVTAVVVLGIHFEKSLPGAADLGHTHRDVGVYSAVLLRILILILWITAGELGEMLLFKWLVLGPATLTDVRMGSWRAVLLLHASMMWDQSLPLCSALFAGGVGINAVLWLLGVRIDVGSVLCTNLPCVPAQDAELISIRGGAIVDEGAYVSAHNVTTLGISHAPTAVCTGAVLHPLAGLFASSLGPDSALYPRAKSLREMQTGERETWVGTPAYQAVCQSVECTESQRMQVSGLQSV